MIKQSRMLLSSTVMASALMLAGCGEDEAPKSAAPAPAPAAPVSSTADAAPAGEFDINTVEKAEGVVYQDEIYANWPYN